MATDRQHEMWITGVALKYMVDNGLTKVSKDVVKTVLDEFVPNEEVDNDLIDRVVSSLKSRVGEYV